MATGRAITSSLAGEPRLDATSKATIDASSKAMGDRLDEAKKKELGAAIAKLALPQMMKAALMPSATKPTEVEIFKPLHGMTADEIIARAKIAPGPAGGGEEKPAANESVAEATAPPSGRDAGQVKTGAAANPAEGWIVAPEAAMHGGVEIRVTSAKVGQVTVQRFNETAQTKEAYLIISIRLLNSNPTRKVDYKTWAGASVSFQRDYATVEDDLGNSYKRISSGAFHKPVGRVESESLYPGKPVDDVLIFEEPLAAAKYLDLEMPAENIGSGGFIRIRIPAELIER
jgi:hypothetical protein